MNQARPTREQRRAQRQRRRATTIVVLVVLGGVLTLSGKGSIREKELLKAVEKRRQNNLKEIVLALSATSEGEHTADHVRQLLAPLRDHLKISVLGRGLATGSELEYSDAETLRAALSNRKEA